MLGKKSTKVLHRSNDGLSGENKDLIRLPVNKRIRLTLLRSGNLGLLSSIAAARLIRPRVKKRAEATSILHAKTQRKNQKAVIVSLKNVDMESLLSSMR